MQISSSKELYQPSVIFQLQTERVYDPVSNDDSDAPAHLIQVVGYEHTKYTILRPGFFKIKPNVYISINECTSQ